MKYISILEASKKFNLTERSIRNYCTLGRIKGAIRQGKKWLIPENATKPERINAKGNNYHSLDYNNALSLLDFINQSPCNFLAVDNVINILKAHGYKEYLESDKYNLKSGDKFFITRNHSSLLVVSIGELSSSPYFKVVSAHSDSPCFKIKPNSDSMTDIYNKINIEPYGGLILSTFLDRPLGIAGRVLYKEDQTIKTSYLTLKDQTVLIPNVCIHFNRDINNGYRYDLATDMQAFISQHLQGEVLKTLIASELKINIDDIVNYDLYLFNKDLGVIWGVNKEYISSPRLDDLECVFTGLKGLLNVSNHHDINILYISDNEEVGSSSRQGADSDFFDTNMKRICDCLNIDYYQALAKSFMISADNAHAVHPNKPGLTDSNNKAYMNGGIVIKYNASNSYTSDAASGAIIQTIMDNHEIPYQFFTNRSDIRGGSTLGNILLSHASIHSVDIGLPQLAMHSAYETAGSEDVTHAINLFTSFYMADIDINGDQYTIK